MNITELKQIAEEAAILDHNESSKWYGVHEITEAGAYYPKNARFIAAATPDLILKLLDVVSHTRALAEIVMDEYPETDGCWKRGRKAQDALKALMNPTDRELLAGAAQAAGIDGELYWDNDTSDQHKGLYQERYRTYWNPLDSNADAFALMVKLELAVGYAPTNVVEVWYSDEMSVEQHIGTDPEAATRRAITRAAYEISKGTK